MPCVDGASALEARCLSHRGREARGQAAATAAAAGPAAALLVGLEHQTGCTIAGTQRHARANGKPCRRRLPCTAHAAPSGPSLTGLSALLGAAPFRHRCPRGAGGLLLLRWLPPASSRPRQQSGGAAAQAAIPAPLQAAAAAKQAAAPPRPTAAAAVAAHGQRCKSRSHAEGGGLRCGPASAELAGLAKSPGPVRPPRGF